MAAVFTSPAPGVLRLGSSMINWYLVADDEGVVLVDAGAPAYRPQLERGLEQLERRLEDVRAVLLTHGDADHKGFAEHVRRALKVPVYVHAADAELTRTGRGRKREASLIPYLRHRAAWKLVAAFMRGGRPRHVGEVRTFSDGDVLDVPGHPRVIHTPGHSPGCVAFAFERQSALFAGDVLFNYNVLTGRLGPQVGPAAFNESSEQALASLERIEHEQAGVMLFGHGDPWTGGVGAAVAAARAAGTS